MSFVYPLGLLGLLGIPILIIIYIIKNKYTEVVVPSTYLWTLSERFLKRRIPINKLVGLISLILQILVVLFVSVAIAHPVFIIPNSAESYCFILDCSGSMNAEQDGTTRFERGVSRITSIINSSVEGCDYTLICVGDTTKIMCEKEYEKRLALEALKECEPAYGSANFTYAVSAAQGYFDENPSVKTYLVTDKAYDESLNVEIIDVSSGENNFAICDVSYVYDGVTLTATGNLLSYEKDAALRVRLYVNDSPTAENEKNIWVNKSESTPFEIECEAEEFLSLRVAITNSDSLALDNEVILYNTDYAKSFTALLVSDTEFFVNSVLTAIPSATVTRVAAKDYKGEEDYDLYIYESYTPDSMPRNGAVWFLNPVGNQPDAGFVVQGEQTLGGGGGSFRYSSSSNATVRKIQKNLIGSDIYANGFMQCGLSRNFTTILSYGDMPVLFVGTNSFGNREVVVAFDIKNTNLPMLADYVTLMTNLVEYTFPEVVTVSSLYCGETLEVNIVAGCDSVRVESPSGKETYLNTGSTLATFEPSEVGIYRITANIGGVQRTYSVFAALPESERYSGDISESFIITGEASNEKSDGRFSQIWFWFLIIAVLAGADWMVYCYEQYQLR